MHKNKLCLVWHVLQSNLCNFGKKDNDNTGSPLGVCRENGAAAALILGQESDGHEKKKKIMRRKLTIKP